MFKRYGHRCWEMLLRCSDRPEHRYEKVERFYGVGNPFNAIYLKVQDRKDYDMEIIRRPFSAVKCKLNLRHEAKGTKADLEDISYRHISS